MRFSLGYITKVCLIFETEGCEKKKKWREKPLRSHVFLRMRIIFLYLNQSEVREIAFAAIICYIRRELPKIIRKSEI